MNNTDGVAVKDVIDFLGQDVIAVFGNVVDIIVKYLRPVESVDIDTLDWIGNNKLNKQGMAEHSLARVIICDPSVEYSDKMRNSNRVIIHVKNPKLAVALIADKYFLIKPLSGIHHTAVVHPDAIISTSAFIGPNCSIGKCVISDNTTIGANTVIYDDVFIGSEVVIHAGVSLGTETLSCERDISNTLIELPHFGKLIIHNKVVIGSNSIVAKGTLSDTIIGEGCKISALCGISHNCIIGKNVWISLGATVAGSVRIGDNVTIWSKVIIRDNCNIGEGAIIGMGSVVTKNIPAGETWFGSPAKKQAK